MKAEDVRGELGEVISGLAPKRQSREEVIVFDSTGTALQDVAAAVVVYEQAQSLDRGQIFSFWHLTELEDRF
jgi:ornithine cyclodeaminase/alanine dehydrogenase-like protein (mu-crystallin family)